MELSTTRSRSGCVGHSHAYNLVWNPLKTPWARVWYTQGYLIYSIRVALSHPTANSRGSVSRSIRIVELTADLRGLGRVVHTFGYAREAPAPFVDRANRRYYLWTRWAALPCMIPSCPLLPGVPSPSAITYFLSRATGWRANAAELFTATSITGPWVSLGNPTKHPTSFDSQVRHPENKFTCWRRQCSLYNCPYQVSYILAVKKRSTRLEFIYLADRFEPYIAGPMCGAVSSTDLPHCVASLSSCMSFFLSQHGQDGLFPR